MKVLTVVGTRPQFIKASMLSMEFNKHPQVEEIFVHTGQHYDFNMSDVFFEQLQLPKVNYNLGVGSGSHSKQTAHMLMELEAVMFNVQPDLVLVYGDTNSTLAGSLAASKLHIPIAHVEAGLRSFNTEMPEEINRKITDHLSSFLFCPTDTAVENLRNEGITTGVYQTGDIMNDAMNYFQPIAEKHSTILEDLRLTKEEYYLATVHRAENTNDPSRLHSIFTAFQELESDVILPLHPGTKRKLLENNLMEVISAPPIRVIEPLNYFDMLVVTNNAKAVLTDSGGLQKEAYLLQTPCLTLRDETEWVETLATGWNQLTSAKKSRILKSVKNLNTPDTHPPLYGKDTAKQIANILIGNV